MAKVLLKSVKNAKKEEIKHIKAIFRINGNRSRCDILILDAFVSVSK